MTVHASLEQLSSYLDAELVERERVDVEEHLSECDGCRSRLAGLRGVVTRLESLDHQAPPADLAFLVERRVAMEADRTGLRAALEETVKTFMLQPSLTPIFGLVVALALIFYLFSFGVAREQAGGTRLVVPPPVADSAPSPGATRTIDGREFRHSGELWIESGLEPVTTIEALDLTGAESVPPELAPFAELGGTVWLTYEGRAVAVVFP